MNKTVNINLASIFFHIDEDAYQKLQHYLDAIKRSFTNTQGRDEILADIEARIAELFTEQQVHDKQVVSIDQVGDIIAIMGQPEDYKVDEDIFEDDAPASDAQSRSKDSATDSTHTEDEFDTSTGDTQSQSKDSATGDSTKSRTAKKLYRDKDDYYVAGVSSGLGHYLGIDAIWIRLLWVLLALGSGGSFVLLYIVLWILIPEAVTTAEKLTMKGEPVNISNIEKKIKDGFETVSESVKNFDSKYGDKLKSGTSSFFDAFGNLLGTLMGFVGKIIGMALVVASAIALISLLIGGLSVGSAELFNPWWMDYPRAVNISGFPMWAGSILLFLLIGIPLFFVLYAGLKILVGNLKSIGKTTKTILAVLWFISLFSIISFGVKTATDYSQEASVSKQFPLELPVTDTLQLKMEKSPYDNGYGMYHDSDFEIKYNEQDEKIIFSRNIRVAVQHTEEASPYITVEKSSKGGDYLKAKNRAETVRYNFTRENNTLLLDNYLTVDLNEKYRDQKVLVTVYLPLDSVVKLDRNLRSFIDYRKSNNMVSFSMAGHSVKITPNEALCLDCPDEKEEVDDDEAKETGDSIL